MTTATATNNQGWAYDVIATTATTATIEMYRKPGNYEALYVKGIPAKDPAEFKNFTL